MAIGRVPGAALLSNLDRQGLDLSFTTSSQTLAYLDFANFRLGINTLTPQEALDVTGNILVTSGNVITSANLIYNIGTNSNWWNNLYANNVTSTNISGTLTTAAQTNITSIGTLSALTVTGNVIAQSSVVPASNIAGNIGYANKWWSAVYANTINATSLTGTILTANQPNITNLGNITVSSISVGGNIVIGGNINGSTITANAFIQNGHAVLDTISTITITGDVTGSGNVSNVAVALGNSGVVAGNYGSEFYIPQITVDSKGRITTASNISLNQVANISFTDTTISSASGITLNSANNGNIIINADGTGTVQITGNDAVGIPYGNTASRPTNVHPGYIRFNTDLGTIEFYNGLDWDNNQSGTITSQTIVPTGLTNSYTLLDDATTDGVLVSINGTLQQPSYAYTVTGNVITFTETPITTDIIEVRAISLAIHAIPAISDGNTRVETDALTGEVRFYNYGTEYLKIDQSGAVVGLNPNTTIASSSVATTIDSYDKTLYRTAKYILQATHLTSVESYEVLVTHNGTTAYLTTYGVINSGSSLGTLSTTISGSNVLLQYTSSSTNTSIRLSKSYLNI